VNSKYEKLIAECLAEMEAVPPMTGAERAYMERCLAAIDAWHVKEHPTPCRRDKNCIRAGGCYSCLVIRPMERATDRAEDIKCWEREIFGPPRTEAERARRAKAKRASLP
jgi:hypothetical protein